MDYQCASDGTVTVSWHEHDGCAAEGQETEVEYHCTMRCNGACAEEVTDWFASGRELTALACADASNPGAGGEGGSK
jgi:hypothetical protein